MYFAFVRMEPVNKFKGKTKKYGFKFSKNGQSYVIYTNSFPHFTSWKRLLANRLIQKTFHEEFEIIKMIGKGSFARV